MTAGSTTPGEIFEAKEADAAAWLQAGYGRRRLISEEAHA
jgi:hypothetical protein